MSDSRLYEIRARLEALKPMPPFTDDRVQAAEAFKAYSKRDIAYLLDQLAAKDAEIADLRRSLAILDQPHGRNHGETL